MAGDLTAIAHEQARMELFAHDLYLALSHRTPQDVNRRTLAELATHERGHVDFWKGVGDIAESSIPKQRLKHRVLLAASRLLGIAFIIRWLERGEERAIATYKQLLNDGILSADQAATVTQILHEEEEHEQTLEAHLSDERKLYLGAAVLGLNDALVELTGALTGLVSSIANPKLIGFAGLVVGVSASMAMAASNFLNVEVGEVEQLHAPKAAAYTGTTYLIVTLGMVAPFFFIGHRLMALVVTWLVAVTVIAAFSYYSSVMQGVSFKKRFGIMLALGLGVALISFGIGHALGSALGIRL
jgi:VIT1/CCC1 family predicted Fe2+/Mn2+ transporter